LTDAAITSRQQNNHEEAIRMLTVATLQQNEAIIRSLNTSRSLIGKSYRSNRRMSLGLGRRYAFPEVLFTGSITTKAEM
jgi:hypothetical protein